MKKYVISVLDEKLTEKSIPPFKVLDKKEAETLEKLKKIRNKLVKKYPGKELLILENFYGKWRKVELWIYKTQGFKMVLRLCTL